MTPEERAREIITRYENGWEDWSDEVRWVAAHIHAAVTEEREACAQLVETEAGKNFREMGDPYIELIAAAIRARGSV